MDASNPSPQRGLITLSREQRDALHRRAAWALEGHFADMCQEFPAIRAKRHDLASLFELLDQIGWEDTRDAETYRARVDVGRLHAVITRARASFLENLEYERESLARARDGDSASSIDEGACFDADLDAIHECDVVLPALRRGATR